MNIIKNRNFNTTNIILVVLVSFLIIILANFLEHSLYSIGILALISYTFFYFSWFIHYKIKINYYTIFLTLTLVFYFGQFILLVFEIPMESGRTILDNRLPTENLIQTGIFIISSMAVLHFGVLMSTLNINNYNSIFRNKDIRLFNNNNKLKSLKIIAYIMLIASIIPSISILFENIIVTITQGYGAIFQTDQYTLGGFNNIKRFLSSFTIPSFLILIIACKNDKNIKIVRSVFVVYLVLYFLSGSRMSGIMLILSLLLVLHYWYKPIKFKFVLKYFFIVLIFLSVLSTISNIRNSLYQQDNIFLAITNAIASTWYNNPIFTILEETGFTFLATGTVLTYSPILIPYQYGMSYINSLLMLIPNLFWEVHPAAAVNTDIIFSSFLTQYGGIGSSFIAEAYWNFGLFSPILILIFGIIIGMITKNIAKYAEKGDAINFFLYIQMGRIILTYVRSDTVSFWRNFVYFGIVPIFLAWLLRHVLSSEKTSHIQN